MVKLYEGIKNFVFKPILYTSLVTMALTGCIKTDASKQNQPAEVKQEMEKTYFDNWGSVDIIGSAYSDAHVELELADFDGDGDLDIIVATNLGDLRVYENRIPQKK